MPKSKTVVRNSLIDGIVTDFIDNHRFDYVKTICRYTQQQDADSAWHRLGMAFQNSYYARQAKQEFDGKFKPEPVLRVIQEIANSMVYRADVLLQQSQDTDKSEVLTGGNGRDFYAERCESYGIEPVDPSNIKSVVEEDLRRLTEIHEIMRGLCSYMDLEPLYLLSQDEPAPHTSEDSTGDDGLPTEWIPKHRIIDFDEALQAIRDDREMNREREQAETANAFANVA